MKITFAGDKAAGKSTLSSLLCRLHAQNGGSVDALNAGIEPELARYLGVSTNQAGDMKPPRGSVLANFAQDIGGVSLVVAGDCRLEKTVLDRFLESSENGALSVVDADCDPDSMQDLTCFDEILYIVEPCGESLEAYLAAKSQLQALHIPFRVVGNKIQGKYDAHFLLKEVGDDLLTCLAHSDRLKADVACPPDSLEAGNQDALAIIHRHIEQLDRRKKSLETVPVAQSFL